MHLESRWELHTTERFALGKLVATRSVRDAAVAVERYYERPAPGSTSKRVAFSLRVFREY